jgi:hypothetical protein
MTTDGGFVSHLAFKKEVVRGSLDYQYISFKNQTSLERAPLWSTVSHGGLHLTSSF